MKIRNGFVSNSSSSSFIVVGFPSEQIRTKPKNIQAAVKRALTTRQIDSIASTYFEKDTEYNAWRLQNESFPDFWEHVYKNNVINNTLRLAADYDLAQIGGVEYVVSRVGPMVEYGFAEVDLDAINNKVNKVMLDFPGTTPQVFLRHDAEM